MSGVSFSYTGDTTILSNVDIDVSLDSRIAVVGANGAGKYVSCISTIHNANALSDQHCKHRDD